jgi:hypothetical protein
MMVSGSGVRQVPMFLLCGFGAATTLLPGSPVYLYGPYKRNGLQTALSNQAFDQSLRDRNPNWGLRDRPRSGCRDGAIRWILGFGYHRNARKQSERGVSPNVIVSVAHDPPAP